MLSGLKTLSDRFSYDLAIDLGTTNTLIYRKGKGVVLDEPSIIAFHADSRGKQRMLRTGAEAKELAAKQPDDFSFVQPVKYGAVADTASACAMLTSFLLRIKRTWFPASIRVIANVPAEATDEEKKSVQNVIRAAGAREVYLLEEPRALAMGAGLDISEDKGNMVLDIGGGITEMAVIVGGKVMNTRSIRIGGQHMDQAIVDYVRKKHNLIVSLHTAEMLKIGVGEAYPGLEERLLLAEGLDIATGIPRFVEISSNDIREALSEPLLIITDTINKFLQSLPGGLYVDILDRGITLAGGGTLLRGIDRLLEQKILMPILKSRDPLACLVLGTGDALEYLKEYRHGHLL